MRSITRGTCAGSRSSGRPAAASRSWRSSAPGGSRTKLPQPAVRDAPFYVIDRGLVELVDRKPGKDVHVAEADGRTFIGDIAMFTGEPTISACVAVEPTDVIAFDRRALREMVARSPEFGEHVFRTLMAGAPGTRPRATA